jgi:hypothetical protein
MNVSTQMRAFILLAGLIVGTFVGCLAVETLLGSVALRADGAIAEASIMRRSLSMAEEADTTRTVETAIARLNLTSGVTQRTTVLAEAVEHASQRENVALILFRRGGSGGWPRTTPVEQLISDSYEIALQGKYSQILRVADDLSGAPLVLRVSSITFERLRGPSGRSSEVRASLEIAVLSLRSRDVHA